ncbi:hypothetical protein LCGC14_1506510 [marine sediment metagenome]|uniref:dATP/dGTP diphosphohydrolase N-terminal domain-containing protein n=1 Tax=marine sediment metagenome TaxID=412755 RepID=A0A0F9LHY4_9ZZZZ
MKEDKGVKHDEGKLRYDLIPPEPLEQLAELYTEGAKKYSDRNWEKGLSWLRCYASMMRHIQDWRQGKDRDKDDGQHPLASVAWYCFALMEYEKTRPEFDDRSEIEEAISDDEVQSPSSLPFVSMYCIRCRIKILADKNHPPLACIRCGNVNSLRRE